MPGSDVQNITQVVFIDSRAPDIQELIAGAAPGQLVFVLDPSTDGVQQIASILENNHLTGLAAISIVGHGASGQIQLGSSWLDEGDLAGHAAALSTIGASLTADGDLLLYACNTAAGTAGQQFIADLAAYTGADVAAATHLVGSADDGGSWTLDASTGAIEAQTPFSAEALANFDGVMAINGQLFITTTGNGGGNVDPALVALGAADNRVMAINSDGTGTTTVYHATAVGLVKGPITAPDDLVLDPASGLYFIMARDPSLTGNNREAVLVAKMDGSAPTVFYQNPDTSNLADIAAISIDAATHTLYVSQIADYNNGIQANNGIFSFSYDPVTGALSNKQQVLSLFPLTPGAEPGSMAAHVVNGLLYFTQVDYTATTGDFRIYSYNVNTHAVTAITPSGVFTLNYTTTLPIITTGESLRSLAVNSTTNKIYFLQYDVGGPTSSPHLWEVSTTPGSTPVEISVPGGLSTSVQDLAIDSATNTLYLSYAQQQQIRVFSIGADGVTLTATGTLPLGLQPPPGPGNPDDEFGSGNSPYDYPTGLDFVDLPTLALAGTSTHAVQQGAALTLLTGAPNITDPTGGYLTGATVTISNFQAGDLLAASVTGTSITASYSNGVLTLSGLDTIAHYKTVLASIAFTGGGTSGVTTRNFDWKVNSGEVNNPSGTNVATTSVTVDVNHPPVAAADVNAALIGATVSGNVILPNDTDADNDTLQVTGFTGSTGAGSPGVPYTGQYGQLTLGSNGAYTYVANNTAAINGAPNNSHPVETITYTISDGHGGTASTTLKITINRPPTATADTAAVLAGASTSGLIGANDTDRDGDSMTATGFSIGGVAGTIGGTVFHGTYGDFTLVSNGTWTYAAGATQGQRDALTSAPAGHPTEVVTYTISDINGATASTTLTITLDRAPVAAADTDTANTSGGPVTGNVVSNDTDADGDLPTVTGATIGGGGGVGTLIHGIYGDITLLANGNYTYQAGATQGQLDALNLAGGHATEVVNYSITDGNGGTASSTLSIDVSTAPSITSVTAVTTGSVTDLNVGKVVTITVNFSAAVDVTGTPLLQLSDSLVATFVGGSGSQALVFSYTVQAGDNSLDLHVLSLLTNGGTIQDAGGQSAILTNAATDLDLHVDTVAPTVTVTADHSTLTLAQGTALVTFTFSEAVALFTLGDVTVTGGSFGALTHLGIDGAGHDVYTAVFTPFAGNAVAGSVQVRPSTYSDIAANAGAASNQITFDGDTVAPTVTVTADHSVLHAGETALVTFTFSEQVAGFSLADVTMSGGTFGTLNHLGIDGAGHDVYTVTFTPDANNSVVGAVQVNAASYTDVIGNVGAAGTPVTFTGDTLAPTVSVTAAPNTLQAGQTSIITFAFSEVVTDFTLADVTMSGGTFGTLTHVGNVGGQDVYTVVFTPDAGNTLAGSVQVNSASYTDAAGNAGAASAVVPIVGDTQTPTVSVVASPDTVGAGQTSTITFTFSEAVLDFTLADVTVSGGTFGTLTHVGLVGGQDVYTVTFTPNVGNTVTASVQVDAGSYTDATGNSGAASNIATITGDSLAPTVSVSADRVALLAGQVALLTFTFSEAVANFALDDATVSGGTLDNLVHLGVNGAGEDVYTAVFTPDVSNTEVGSVQVNAAGYTDVAGNTGAASNTVNFSGDTLAPAVSVTTDRTTLLAGQVALLTFTFSEANPAFALSDIFVQGGTLDNLVHLGINGAGEDIYTASFTLGAGNTTGQVYVNGQAYADAAGNQSAQSNIVGFSGDAQPPTVSVTADHNTLHAGDTALVTFTFSEAVAGFGLVDVTLSGGALSNLVHLGIDGSGHDIYTAIFTPVVTDNLSGAGLSVNASSYTDVAGNAGAASNAVTFTGDTKVPAAPTLALQSDTGVSSTDHITNNPAIIYSASAVGDTLRYTVDGTPGLQTSFADGTHTVSVEEVDAAGNVSAASSLTFTLDTTAPHLTGITASPSSGNVPAGSTVQLTLDFDEEVTVSGGTPTLTLNDGGSAVYVGSLLGDASKLVFDYVVSPTQQASALAVTGFAANGATVSDIAGNHPDLSAVTAVFDALEINELTAPAYTIGGITRPELHFDTSGNILLDAAALEFASHYGIEYLYLGLPPGTPYPPVADLHV